jgi:hypothetical protein
MVNQRIRHDFLRNEIYPAANNNFQGSQTTEDGSFDFNTEADHTGNRHNFHRRAAQRYSALGGSFAILPDVSNVGEISIRYHDCAAHFPGETVGQLLQTFSATSGALSGTAKKTTDRHFAWG